jgi:ATP-dependent Lon protease
VILPKRNELDLEDLPEEIRRQIKFIFVETVDEVLEAALEPAPSTPERKRVRTKAIKETADAQSVAG